jgi:hypothetical protein
VDEWDQELIAAQAALDMSAINGIICLAIMLKKRGLMTLEEMSSMHESMSKPLALSSNANNSTVQSVQRVLDDLFATMTEKPFISEG